MPGYWLESHNNPLGCVVRSRRNYPYEGKDQFQRDEAGRSGALAEMTIMLAAQGKGLASGAMSGFDPVAVSAECKLASNEIPVMLLAVGRPAPGNWPRKVRRDVGAVLSFSAD